MATPDIIILVCLIPAIIEGISKGFIVQVIGLASVIIGAWLAFHFSEPLCTWLTSILTGVSADILHVVLFAVILMVSIVILNLLGHLIRKVVKLALLGWLDRILGIALSLAKYILIIGLVIILFTSLNGIFEWVDEASLADTKVYAPVKDIAYKVFPYLKALIFHHQ